jgi:hypothetical protein
MENERDPVPPGHGEPQPQGRSMQELHRLVDEDNARFDELAEAWPNLLVSEQEALVKQAKEAAAGA